MVVWPRGPGPRALKGGGFPTLTGEVREFAATLREEQAELSDDLHGLLRSAAVARLTVAREVVGLGGPGGETPCWWTGSSPGMGGHQPDQLGISPPGLGLEVGHRDFHCEDPPLGPPPGRGRMRPGHDWTSPTLAVRPSFPTPPRSTAGGAVGAAGAPGPGGGGDSDRFS